MITKEEFNLWKDHVVTKAFFENVESLEQGHLEQLQQDVGSEKSDLFRGAVFAFRAILETEVGDLE